MPLDGLTLHALTNELEPLLKNGRVLKIYQPDAYTITLQLRLPGKTETLLLSVDPQYPRLHTIDEQPINPLNPPAFCMLLRKYLEPSRLLIIKQHGFDRILQFDFEALADGGHLHTLSLILELMGGQSNLYLVNQEGAILDALKRNPEKGVFPGEPYRPPSDQGKLTPTALSQEEFLDELRLLPAPTNLVTWLAQTFQGFSRVAALEVVKRSGYSAKTIRADLESGDWIQVQQTFFEFLRELKEGGFPAWYPKEEDFAAYTLTGAPREAFSSTDSLLRTVLGEKSKQKDLASVKSALRRQLNNHRKRIEKKEAIQVATLKEAEGADFYRLQGELLTASFHLIKPGERFVEVPNYHAEGSPMLRIELDPRHSPSMNVQRVFKRYNKMKASQKFTAEQLEKTREERSYLEDIFLQIELADDQATLLEIEQELVAEGYLRKRTKARPGKAKHKPEGPTRYLSSDGIIILVGRNNHQNDYLTFKLTAPNQTWLHARNIPGSHVAILAAEPVPDPTLWEAANLAAYFSQGRTSPKVAVDYTQRRHVRKPKGARPGFVHYDQAKTILANPAEFVLPPKEG